MIKKVNLIPTTKFVKAFPLRVTSLVDLYCYDTKPIVKHRLFRYYVTKGFMPKPIIINKKANYRDTQEMYDRLFLVWFLIHYRRKSISEISNLMYFLVSKEHLLIVITNLFSDAFIDDLISSRDINGLFAKHFKEISVRRQFVKRILVEYLKEDEKMLDDMYKELDLLPESRTPLQLIKLEEKITYYASLKDQISKNLNIIQRIKATYNR